MFSVSINSKNNNFFERDLYFNANSLAQSVAYSAQPIDLLDSSDTNPSNIKVRSTENSSYTNNVTFREGLSGNSVSVGLSNENLQRLQEVFGDKEVKRGSRGDVVLSGEAEKFVSSWFNDIAYKRGYAKSDLNNDGTLSFAEKFNTSGFFGGLNQSHFISYRKVTEFANPQDTRGIDKQVSDSIEKELNRTLEYDKDMNGKISVGDMAPMQDIIDYVKEVMASGNGGYQAPSFDDIFGFLKQIMKDLKEMLKEELKKAGIDSNTIDLNASAEEVFKQIMEKDNGAEVLQNIKEKLENQGKNSEDSTFKEIAKLTKLDEETLAYNLNNNPNFEEDIISIVQELTQNVDTQYFNALENPQKALDILA